VSLLRWLVTNYVLYHGGDRGLRGARVRSHGRRPLALLDLALGHFWESTRFQRAHSDLWFWIDMRFSTRVELLLASRLIQVACLCDILSCSFSPTDPASS
jgi:hypothetical protein